MHTFKFVLKICVFTFTTLTFTYCNTTTKVAKDTIIEPIKETTHPALTFHWPYEINQPTQTIELDPKLKEISGLSLNNNPSVLTAVQDENGILYNIDKQTGNIRTETIFWKDGDYEGIEMVGDDTYVVKSTGTIYQIKHAGTEGQEVIKHKFFLTKEDDVEGLCHDEMNNRLLLVCKGTPVSKENKKPQKFIYSFDLKTHLLDSIPNCLIDLQELKNYIDAVKSFRDVSSFDEILEADPTTLTFHPSAVAINPIDKHLYIASSRGKMFGVMRADGKILYMEKLDKATHCQPEGITFEKDGTMYISNEGKKENPPRIHSFNYRDKSKK